jgi:hypothetical protein
VIRNDSSNGNSIKAIKDKEKAEKEAVLKQQCEEMAKKRFTEDQVKKWSNQYKGLFFLPILNDHDQIEKLAIMKPIDRHILSYASTKISDEGLYSFLEACMRECFIDGDKEIIEDDEYFIPAANTFNKILEGKKASLVKR